VSPEETAVGALFSAGYNFLKGNYIDGVKDLFHWATKAVKQFVEILVDCYDSIKNVIK